MLKQDMLGFTHADMGSWLTEKWKLDETLVATIRHHHFPSRAQSNLEYIALVHVADYLTSENILSVTKKKPSYLLDRGALEILKLSENDFNSLKPLVQNNIFH